MCLLNKEGLTNISPVCGPSETISELEVDAALVKKKQGKSADPTGVSKMFKAAGETGILRMCNPGARDGKFLRIGARAG